VNVEVSVHVVPVFIVAVAVIVEVPIETPVAVVVYGEVESEAGLTVATQVLPETKETLEILPPCTVVVAVRVAVPPI